MGDNYSMRESAGSLTGAEIIPCFKDANPLGGKDVRTTAAELAEHTRASLYAGIDCILGSGAPVDAVTATVVLEFTTDNSDLTLTAYNAGADGNLIYVELVDPGDTTAETTVAVTYGPDQEIHYVVTLAHDGEAITATAGEVATALTTASAGFLAETTAAGTGLGLVEATAATPLASGMDATGGPVPSFRVSDDGSLLYVKVNTVTWKEVALSALGGA